MKPDDKVCASGTSNLTTKHIGFTFSLFALYLSGCCENYPTNNKIRRKINKLNPSWDRRGKSLTRGRAYGPAMLLLTLPAGSRGQPCLHPSPSVLLQPVPPSCSIVFWWPSRSAWPSHLRFIWKGSGTVDPSRSSVKKAWECPGRFPECTLTCSPSPSK